MVSPARGPAGDITFRLIAGRVAVATLLLGTLTVIQLYRPGILPFPRSEQLYKVIIATYLLSLAYIGAAARGLRSDWFHKGQFGIDILLATLMVVYSGGIDSPFAFVYPVIILAASVVFRHRETFTVAGACLVTYGGVVLLQRFYPIPALFPYPPPPAASPVYLVYTLFLIFLAFFLIAFLGDHLANALRKADKEIDRQREDLADLQAQTSHIFRSLVSGLMTADLQGRVLAINPAGEQILGLSAGSAAGKKLLLFFGGGNEIAAFLDKPPDEPLRTEFAHRRGESRGEITVGLTISRLVNDRGEQSGFLAIFQDLTPMRAMEEEVRRTQRLAALGEMAAGLAHELKNPLAPIAGSVEMLRDRVDEADRPLIELILRETERLDHLVNNFLQYARPLPLATAPVDLDGLITDLLALIGREGRLSNGITISFSPGINGPVMIDQRMITQVLWNLVNNAAEAIAQPGTIAITTSVEGEGARVTVTDTGEGITPELLSKVFTPFYTTRDTGTGLGLAICERIISLHGGTVTIDSAPGRGTTVSFTIAGTGRKAPEREVAHGGDIDSGR